MKQKVDTQLLEFISKKEMMNEEYINTLNHLKKWKIFLIIQCLIVSLLFFIYFYVFRSFLINIIMFSMVILSVIYVIDNYKKGKEKEKEIESKEKAYIKNWKKEMEEDYINYLPVHTKKIKSVESVYGKKFTIELEDNTFINHEADTYFIFDKEEKYIRYQYLAEDIVLKGLFHKGIIEKGYYNVKVFLPKECQ